MKRPAFQIYQLALTAHLRSPKEVGRPASTSKKRVAIYADLVFNNLNSFLETTFPVLRAVLKKKRWKQLVRLFLRDHRSDYPLFRDIPLALLDYLATLNLGSCGLPPFTLELAHYEWLELKLDVDARRPRWATRPLLPIDRPLAVNPVLELVAYRYPVHAIGPSCQPDTPAAEPNFLLVWRNRQHRVRFMQLNSAAAQLLHALQQGQSPHNAVGNLSTTMEAVPGLLASWFDADILLGRPARRSVRLNAASIKTA